MTRKEQINTLTAIIQECEEYQHQRKEALYEIIKVLEKDPSGDCIDRQEVLNLIRMGYSGKDLLMKIHQLSPVEPKTGLDS